MREPHPLHPGGSRALGRRGPRGRPVGRPGDSSPGGTGAAQADGRRGWREREGWASGGRGRRRGLRGPDHHARAHGGLRGRKRSAARSGVSGFATHPEAAEQSPARRESERETENGKETSPDPHNSFLERCVEGAEKRGREEERRSAKGSLAARCASALATRTPAAHPPLRTKVTAHGRV